MTAHVFKGPLLTRGYHDHENIQFPRVLEKPFCMAALILHSLVPLAVSFKFLCLPSLPLGRHYSSNLAA